MHDKTVVFYSQRQQNQKMNSQRFDFADAEHNISYQCDIRHSKGMIMTT